MNTQCSQKAMDFKRVGSRKVVADFSGGTITSDGGVLLLPEVDERLEGNPVESRSGAVG